MSNLSLSIQNIAKPHREYAAVAYDGFGSSNKRIICPICSLMPYDYIFNNCGVPKRNAKSWMRFSHRRVDTQITNSTVAKLANRLILN